MQAPATAPGITKDDQWEALVSQGVRYAEILDERRWDLGDLAEAVEREYGKSTLAKFAYAINVRTGSLYEYHRVSSYFSTHVEFRKRLKGVSWSHYREAMRLKDKGRLAVLKALVVAHDNELPVEKFHDAVSHKLGKPTPPPRPIILAGLEGVPCKVIRVNHEMRFAVIEFEDAPAGYAALKALVSLWRDEEKGLLVTVAQQPAESD